MWGLEEGLHTGDGLSIKIEQESNGETGPRIEGW